MSSLIMNPLPLLRLSTHCACTYAQSIIVIVMFNCRRVNRTHCRCVNRTHCRCVKVPNWQQIIYIILNVYGLKFPRKVLIVKVDVTKEMNMDSLCRFNMTPLHKWSITLDLFNMIPLHKWSISLGLQTQSVYYVKDG